MQDQSPHNTDQNSINIITLEEGTKVRLLGNRTSDNFKGRTVANSLSVIIGWLIPTAILLFLTPYLVQNIGKEAYGVFTLTTVLTGYVAFMDLGFGDAITKHTAQYAALDDSRNLTRTVSAGLIIFTIVGLVGGSLLVSSSSWLVHRIFNIPIELHDAAVFAIQIAGLGFFLNMFTSLNEGLAMGMNHFEIPNNIRIFRVSLSSLFMILAMINGRGLPGVMTGNVLGQAIATAVSSFVTFRLVPRPRLEGAISHIPELFAFGKFVFINRVINTVSSQIGTTVLGIFSTMTSLTYFDIPTKMIRIGMEVFQRLFLQLFPLSAGLSSQGKRDLLTRIFVSLIRWQIILLVPIFLLVLFFGHFAIQLWIGKDFANNGYSILIVTVLTQIISVLTGVPSQYALGLGKPNYPTMFGLVRLLLIGAFIYPLVRYYGALGAALTLFIGGLQGVVFIFFIARRLMNINLWSILRGDLLKLGGLISVFLALWIVVGGRLNSYSSILLQIGAAILLLAVYTMGIIMLGILPMDQVHLFRTREFWNKI